MMKFLIPLIVGIICFSTAKADYTAAVVEYSPSSEATPNATVEKNIDEYTHYIAAARSNNVQIIVFPEYGLTGLVEDPADYAIEIPINTGSNFDNYWLQKLSNSARENYMYVVVNLLEKARNEKNNTIYYNTNIVFDRNGQIVARYRKINLYFEPKITPGNEVVTFATDFGVTFGIFTCSDILYHNPSKTILSSGIITDIIFPTAWTSVLPFYHSLTIQSGYSQANKVNLLAADYNSPSRGLGGSGIYRHDGTIETYYISGISSSKLLVANVQPRGVPRNENPFNTHGFDILNNSQSELNNFISVRDFKSSDYVFKPLTVTTSEIQETVCHGSFCCNFVISAVDVTVSEVYKVLVYNGNAKLADSTGNVKFCAVISCENNDVSTCGSRNVELRTKFSNIAIKGTFKSKADHFYQPVTLTTGLLPIFNTSFVAEGTNESVAITFTSTRTVENLVVFGVFGRGGAPAFGSSIAFLVIMSVLKFLL